MSFGQPGFLAFLVAVPLVGLLLWLNFRWKERASARLGDPSMMRRLTASTHRGRQRFKAVLLAAAVLLLAVAAARPLLGLEEEVQTRVGSDVLVALDVSLSMAAQDVSPSRLDRAKEEIVGLIDRLQGDRVGLVIFAGAGLVRFPLTTDLDAARTLVRSVELDSAPRPGSALAEAIRTALSLVDPEEQRDRVLVLVSDGEDLGSQLTAAAEEAARQSVPLFTVGVGTAEGGTIPIKDTAGRVHLKRDRTGQVVTTRMDENTLRLLAAASSGRYYLATSGQSELDRIYAEIARRSRTTIVTGVTNRPREGFQVFAMAAFLALSLEWLITERREERA